MKNEANQQQETNANKKAIVISASRRHAIISPDGHNLIKGTCSVKTLNITVGDQVLYSAGPGGEVFIESILPRKNTIARSYRGDTREIAVNLDHLFIVAAVAPLFNTIFIDRVATVAYAEDIPVTLLVNKVDLGVEPTERLIDVYGKAGYRVILTSAKFGSGLEDLRATLAAPQFSVVALAGISGVGKSTFVNQLVPGAKQETQIVTGRVSSGRQTTTQAFGFLYERSGASGVLIIDLPGIQHFGVSHLRREQVAEAFPEIQANRTGCEFSNCAHRLERNCAVKKAVEEGRFAGCRYESYLHMLDELDQVKPY